MDTTCAIPTCDTDAGTAYVCRHHGDRCAEQLRRIADLADAARDAAYGLVRYGAGGRRTDVDAPLPGNLTASTVLDECTSAVTTWARHVADQRGLTVSTGADPLAAAAAWLAGHLEYARHQQWAAELVDEIGDVERRIVRLADRPPTRVLVGACPCGTWVYAVTGRARATCGGCQTVYDVATSQAALWQALLDRDATTTELADIAVRHGHDRRRAHTLIRSWTSDRAPTRNRGARPATLHPVGDRDGKPVYRIGDVLDRLAATPSRKPKGS